MGFSCCGVVWIMLALAAVHLTLPYLRDEQPSKGLVGADAVMNSIQFASGSSINVTVLWQKVQLEIQ